MPRKLRVGVIGTSFGGNVHVPTFQAHPRSEVVAVAGGNIARARVLGERFRIPHVFDDYAKLVRADVDLVAITTPPYLHQSMALTAINADRHVLCEKPLAVSVSQATEMLNATAASKAAHLVDHELRFNPNRRKIKQLIEQGFIGHPRHVLVTAVGAIRSMPWTWWSDAGSGGGILGAIGSHHIDLLRFCLGEIVSVSGTTRTFTEQRVLPDSTTIRQVTSDDFAAFSMRFASGAVGTMVAGAAAAHPTGPRLEVWGDEGSLLLDEAERLWGTSADGGVAELTEPETLAPPAGMAYASLWGLSFVRLADHIITALLDGHPTTPAATFRDGLQVQRVMDAVRNSTTTGWQPIAQPSS